MLESDGKVWCDRNKLLVGGNFQLCDTIFQGVEMRLDTIGFFSAQFLSTFSFEWWKRVNGRHIP